jgi:aerobic-type carbon monoxide dehydrogenase small subunit (CoxS/CutS family)
MELKINGEKRRADVDGSRTLLSVLRDEFDLTGAKYGCGEGQCGSCTVLLDGAAVRSCITTLKTAADKQITTIEGLEKEGHLHPLQQAFLDADAMQCGYCTSGMIMNAASLLGKNPAPRIDEIIRAMQGNICRCGTYPRILSAISMAAAAIARGSHV